MDKLLQKRISSAEQQVLSSEFFKRFRDKLSFFDVKRIVAYGLGRVVTCLPAMHQAIFCSKLASYLHIEFLSSYDPIYSDNDFQFLESLGFQREYFPFHISNDVTLVFMPHCDGPVNKVIIELMNSHPLHKFLLFCNILNDLQLETGNIQRVYGISGAYPRDDVFNDCALYSVNIPLNENDEN